MPNFDKLHPESIDLTTQVHLRVLYMYIQTLHGEIKPYTIYLVSGTNVLNMMTKLHQVTYYTPKVTYNMLNKSFA